MGWVALMPMSPSWERYFQGGLIGVIWLLPFIRIEPAPVDFLIWILGGMLLLARPWSYWHALSASFRVSIVLLAVSHVSLIWAPDWGRAVFYTAATAEMFVIWIIFQQFRGTEQAWHRLCVAVVGSSAMAASIGILAYFDLIPYSDAFMFFNKRAMSVFQGPNVFGGYLVMVLTWLWFTRVSCVRWADRWPSWAYAAIAFLLTYGLILSGSRMAAAGLALSLLLYVGWTALNLRAWRETLRRWLRGWAIAVGMLAAVGMSFHPAAWSMLEGRLSPYLEYDAKRFHYQQEAARRSSASGEGIEVPPSVELIFGKGPGQSENVLGLATHNLYLRVWYELGLVGTVGLALFLVLTARTLWVRLQDHPDTVALLSVVFISILAMSLVIDTLHWRHFFVVMGLALGTDALGRETESAE